MCVYTYIYIYFFLELAAMQYEKIEIRAGD